MEQLLVASPSLYDSVIDFDKCNEKKKQNVKVSLNSYSKRAAFRTTPFGIFTAINTVDLTKGTTSNVQKVSFIKKAVPDYSWIYSLVKSYEISNLEKLSLKINTAAFTQGDRYVLPFTVNESEEDRNISFSKPIKLLVEKCKTRYIKYEELIDVFKNNYPDIVSDMLESYIHDLVTNDFLISDLRPPICNINSLDYLLSKLEEGTLCTDLTTLKKMIEDYNDLNIGEGRDLLLQIFDKMESIYKYDNGGNYLKVDSLAEYEGDFNILSETARESIERLAEMFVKLNTNVKRRGGRKNSLEEYQLKFIGKYGENCSIPFVEVINKDAGIGFPEYYKGGEGEAIELSDPIMQMFEKKYEEALLNGGHIEFYSKDLDDFQTDQSNSLDSFELNFNIKIINNDVKLYLGANIGSGQAGRSFGRFYGLSETVRETIKNLNHQNNKYSVFLSRDVDLKKVEYARVLLIALINLIISMILSLMLIVISFVLPTPSLISIGRILLTILLIWLTTLWQIPFILWLSRKINVYFAMIINIISPLIIGTSFSLLNKWYLFPYDWSLKLLEPMTRMRINSIPFGAEFVPDYSQIFISLFLGIAFFILLTNLFAISFKKQVK
ncbi:TPA: lantibiotic immunity ABC transporter MutE/EpiE family permease subunit [Streptococcus pyogenes]|nr:lantibiotic immunity ABC transporter MutE/EpiE family permease subunit [Streptococcus pyogenes]HEQ6488060.1 lantibiotic immunity ABC transporter MutE/EpiE family permease subunit [Streptococcus pyogenes]HEQ6515688.1 lantibiotic immunity ABC transporter MutE/EpiE family permease subunit [Streptococcus pyogenes]HEQ6592643.1 lantibiotic immunity ABC transporter MutE/EpiE family permease subunit [Streptococcus pyogenes]HEQ6658147.1 lantibiotic immunity ABC transporter MutE/EpiE family permease s